MQMVWFFFSFTKEAAIHAQHLAAGKKKKQQLFITVHPDLMDRSAGAAASLVIPLDNLIAACETPFLACKVNACACALF